MKIRQWFDRMIPIGSFSRPARLFLLATIIDGTIFSAWSLFFNLFILARGYDKQFLGLANAMPNIASLLFGIPMGMLSDRIGRRKAMLIGLAINILALGAQVFAPNGTILLATAFIGGIGGMLFVVSQAPFMMKVSTEENRPLLFSLNYGLLTLAGAVGSLFAGQLPAYFSNILKVSDGSAISYQAVLICSVVLGSFCLLPIFLLREPPDPVRAKKHEEKRKNNMAEAFRQPIIWKLLMPNMMIGIGAAILIPYMNVFFRERFQFQDSQLGVLFSLSALITGVGTVIGPNIAKRLGGKIRFVVFSQGMSVFFLMMVGFSPLGFMSAGAFLARGALMNMAQPLYSAFSMEQIDPADQGTANSLFNVGWTLGWAVGPYVSGLIQETLGFSPLFIATTVIYAVAISLTWAFFHKSEESRKLVLAGLEADKVS